MPKLKIDITPSLQKLDLVVNGLVNTKFMGNYASAFKGQGLEFSDFRSYSPSDDAGVIDWVASNRSRKLLVKEYVEERNLNVHFVVDVSSKMLLGSTKKLKAEYAAELVSSFSNTILRAGDFVGLTMFSDKVIKNILPTNGMKQFHIISEALSNLSFYGGENNFSEVFAYALKFFDEGSLVIIISDFVNTKNIADALKYTSKKFDLIGIMVRDPIDISLPDGMGQVMVEDPATGERLLISPRKLKSNYSRFAKKQVADLKKEFKIKGADFLELYTNKSFVEELVSFFHKRKLEWK
ncbi:DUF58 domain-containing protein [archaeon]|jgi:uncharacterized protein (DUF58 family)|nr:DUF58 domain-containing protein [archaeon]MBT4373885.1 DUF58 domain-containing protein [archaeon]MBT4532407.1 DUF58 domain-containing protein [archaeon]MBT7001788.1 DUF58 domain-containing protein [archaeon]MBT7281887.1 DUF58 domain-containing protein [archaeon]